MKYIFIISLVLVVLTGINMEWEFLSNRTTRVLSSFAFFFLCAVITYKKRIPPFPLIALFLLAMTDIFLLNWEYELSKPMYYSVHSLANLTLLSCLSRKEGKPSLSLFDWLYIATIAGILSWVMVTLGQFFSDEMNNPILEVLFYINGFLSVILAISAFIFSANSTDSFSPYLLLAIVGLTISDLFLFMIFIMDFMDLRYLDNFLNILGCALLVKYMIRRQSVEEEQENTQIIISKDQEDQKDLTLQTSEKIKIYS